MSEVKKTVVVEVNVDSEKAQQEIDKLKAAIQELDDATVDTSAIDKLEESLKGVTTEATKAQEGLKGISTNLNALTGEDKIRGLDGGIKILAGSIQGAVGSLGLLGVESEQFGKFEEKAASAIAVGVGLKDFSEGAIQVGDALRKAGAAAKIKETATKALTIVQKAFNAVVSLNPVGILILSLTAAGALIFAFRDKILNLIKVALGPFSGVIDSIAEGFNNLAVAVGLADDEITKATKNNIAQLEKQIKLVEANGESSLELQKKLSIEKGKLLEKDTKEFEDNLTEQQVLDIKSKKEASDRDKVAADEKALKDKERRQKAIEDEKERLDTFKSLLKSYIDEELDLLADTDQKRLDLEKSRGLQEIDNLKLTQEERIKLIAQFNEVSALKQKELDDKTALDRQTKAQDVAEILRDIELGYIDEATQAERDRLIAYEDTEVQKLEAKRQFLFEDFELERTAIENKLTLQQATDEQRLAVLTAFENARKEIIGQADDEVLRAKEDNAEAERQLEAVKRDVALGFASSGLSAIQGLLGKNAKAQKAFAIGQATIDTFRAINAALATANPLPGGRFIEAGIAAATGLANIKKIISTREDGVGAQPTAPIAPRTPMGQAPSVPQLTRSFTPQANQIGEVVGQQMSTRPIKTYVSLKDINTASEMARLGSSSARL